jgi:hypothetical protein
MTDEDELDEFEELQLARDLVEIAGLMMKLSPEEFEKEFEDLCSGLEFTGCDLDHETFRKFLKQGAPWGRAVLRKYKQ